MFALIGSIISTIFFMLTVAFFALVASALWFFIRLKSTMRSASKRESQRRTQQQAREQQQQTSEAKVDLANEQPIYDDANAEYVDYEEVK